MARAPVSKTGCRGFESLHSCQVIIRQFNRLQKLYLERVLARSFYSSLLEEFDQFESHLMRYDRYMLDTIGKIKRLLPYIVFIAVNLLLFGLYIISSGELRSFVLNILSNGVFFFIVFIFFDLFRSRVRSNETRYIGDYIKNKISNDIFVALYFQKKIIHGYNLDTNTLQNIMGILNYSKEEIRSSVKNQRYLGFQIFKDTDEIRSLFDEILNNNLVLRYSSHLETISLLKIVNNLNLLEVILKNEDNFNLTHPESQEFTAVNGKDINPSNPEGYLLLRRLPRKDRFVVYDSGIFEKQHLDKLLNEYSLKPNVADRVSEILFDTFHLMQAWLPEVTRLRRGEGRFRIIKQFFSPATTFESGDAELYVADVIQTKK